MSQSSMRFADIAQDGRTVDMYAAMQVGFDSCKLQPGIVCQVIGITDKGCSELHG